MGNSIAAVRRLVFACWFAAACSWLPAAAETRHRLVTDFGAVGDGVTLNTTTLQRAFDEMAAAGGGVLEFPRGTFRSGALDLRPGVELSLAEGAVLLGSNRIEDYPTRDTRVEGRRQRWRPALLNGTGLTGVRLSGPGTIDGNGVLFWAAFWQRRKENPKCTNLEVERPRLLFLDGCTDVRLAGLKLQDSGFWNVHLYRCCDVLLEDVRITAPTKGGILGPSTDGVDIDSSQRVTLRRCFISVNDDNIALKGSKGPLADRDTESPPVEDILVEDCEFGDGNAVVTCGSEATVVRHVTVRNITINGRNKLLQLKLRPDTPQHYEHILIDGAKVAGTGRLILVAPWRQFFDLQGHPAPTREVNDVTIRNVTGECAEFGEITLGEGDTLHGFTLENVELKLAKPELKRIGGAEIVMKNVRVNGAPLVGQ